MFLKSSAPVPTVVNGCEIMSLDEIATFLRHQGSLRSLENDDRGVLYQMAQELEMQEWNI